MHIQVTLTREEFEPVLIDLLNRSLNREIKPEQVKQIRMEYGQSVRSCTFIADIDFSEPPPSV